jgi:NADH:ubiquinone reductase (H+-translocating)
VPPDGDPLLILGAGYAGLTLAQEVDRRSRGRLPTVLVDRHPVHVLRTELYEVGRLAAAEGATDAWTVPLAQVFERSSVQWRAGEVQGIDLEGRAVVLDGERLGFSSLAICLGSVAAYYGVPGAAEHTHSVYRLTGARALAHALRELEAASPHLAGERRPRVVVVGGGSTGTEVAAEIATTDWAAVTGLPARPPEVCLVTGSLPLLAGLPGPLIERAEALLRRAGVALLRGYNSVRVDPDRIALEDGTVLVADLVVWCAGLEAPGIVRGLPVPHGKGGRIAVEPTLEVRDRPGLFAVGDVAEIHDPTTGALVPGTAQAALAEARAAAGNLVARWQGRALAPFRYRERGVALSLGRGQGAASVRALTVWGSPAALLKRVVQRDYARSVERGAASELL